MPMLVMTLAGHTGEVLASPVRGVFSVFLFLGGIVLIAVAVYLVCRCKESDDHTLPR